MIRSKWVDTIKKWYERHKPGFEPRYKSRLVGCGNFEQDDGVRTDAPASDLETHCVVAAFAACNRTTIRSSDISNAYFQAQPLPRKGDPHASASRRTTWCRSGGGIVGTV